MKTEVGFTHRKNADGTFDSICLSCFRTVGSANIESELTESERQHICPNDFIFIDGRGRK